MTTSNNSDTRDAAEIERDIHSAQAEMGRTVDQIGDQLTPRNVLNALLDEADERGIDVRYIFDGARRNPIALGMIAIGGIWLVSDSDAKLSSLKPSGLGGGSDANTHDEHRSYLEHMSRCEPQPGEEPSAYRRRRDVARANYFMLEQRHDEDETSFRERLNETTDKLRERRDSLLESAHQMGRTAGHAVQDTAGKAIDSYMSNPLIGGVVAALAGALAGSLVPITRTEEEQVGALSSRTLDAARDKAEDLAASARDKKDELIDKVEEQSHQGDRRHREAPNGASGKAGQADTPRRSA